MAELRLSRLPDRVPVKLTIQLSPELSQRLSDYAELYRDTYGQAEPVHELIPAMLTGFLDSDKAFSRRKRDQGS